MTISPKEIAGAEIYVVKSGSRVIVRPACVALRNGETLDVYNFTGGEVQVFIPLAEAKDRNVCLKGEGNPVPVPIRIAPRDNKPFLGPVPYAVFCDAQGEFAEGESTPKIIIKP